ncbi:MAG TPA: radical SAM protein, partial [Polyangiaceae bacterium]
DLLLADGADWGALHCGCHPNCGIGTALLVNKRTRAMVPLAEMLDLEGLLSDLREITDAAQPRAVTLAEVGLSLCRRFDARRAPPGFTLGTLLRQFLSQTGARGRTVGEHATDAGEFEWRVLFVAGMWFQDLFNYDFRRTEMCIIPYGTQEGEISFCAYNTGVGWRQIVEKMHATATVADWYRANGRHPVYAKNQRLELPGGRGTVRLPILT